MKALRAWMLRLAGLFSRRHSDVTEEFESHLEMQIADNLRAGMSADQARRAALLKAGGLTAAREAYRDRSTVPLLENFILDLRFTIRQLIKRPGYSVTTILVLAVGMAGCTAIFAFVDAALIKPIPYKQPAELMELAETSESFPIGNISYADFEDWKRYQKAFRSLDAFTGGAFLLNTKDGAEPVRAGRVTAGFFRTLGVEAALGRDFANSEDVPGGPRVVMLSYELWQQKFGGSKRVLGQRLFLSGDAYTIIGVLPANFHFALLNSPSFWTTMNPRNFCEQRRTCHNLFAVARLDSGISRQQALAQMSSIAARLERQYPDSNRGRGASVIPLSEAIIGQVRPILLILLGGAALLLLIAYVNVASLVLVRSEGRRREIAVRSALGASTMRLITEFASEAIVLVAGSSTAGLLFASWTMHMIQGLIPIEMLQHTPFLLDIGVSAHVAAFCVALGAVATVLLTLTALLHFGLSRMSDGLAEGSRGSAGRGWQRTGSRLVVVELATATVLLVGAALLGKSLYQLLHVDIGFRPDHLAVMEVAAPDNNYGKPEQSARLGRDLVRKVESVPGVQSAALSTGLLVSENGNTDWIRIVGKPYDGKHQEVNERDVSSKFFETVGARLLRGRYFNDEEDASKPEVVVINQALATKYFPGEDPIGKQIGDTTLSPKSIKTIIGVVNDIREGSLDQEIWPAEYHPLNQDPSDYFILMARTSQQPGAALPEITRAVHQLHSDIGVRNPATMETLINNSVTAALHRACAWLVAGFAGSALLLGVVGLYGVIAYSVSQRTREIGVRMALGAEHSSVYRLILREAGWLAVLGIGIGSVGAVAGGAFARKLLFGVSVWDPGSLIAVAAILAGASMAASFVPAQRAASVNPVDALRAE